MPWKVHQEGLYQAFGSGGDKGSDVVKKKNPKIRGWQKNQEVGAWQNPDYSAGGDGKKNRNKTGRSHVRLISSVRTHVSEGAPITQSTYIVG